MWWMGRVEIREEGSAVSTLSPAGYFPSSAVSLIPSSPSSSSSIPSTSPLKEDVNQIKKSMLILIVL